MIVSSISSPAFIGSSLILTCFIMLVESVVGGVELEVVWIGATKNLTADNMTTNTGSSYTSTLTFTNLTASDDGNYTCNASLSSSLPFLTASPTTSHTITITTGIIFGYTWTLYLCTYIYIYIYIYLHDLYSLHIYI